MADRSVVVRLLANISDFQRQMAQAEKSVDGLGKKSKDTGDQASTSLGRLAQSAQSNRDAWDTTGTALTAFGVATVGALYGTVRAATQWESAWAGVTKTVDGTPEQLQAVEDGLRGLARQLPASQTEIAGVAEAAGQLGVKTQDVVGFTKTMIDLGETTNLSADEAATALAQLMNVMGTAPQDVGRLGASLVALGNAGASTEADILNMASYLSGAAALIGASESDVLALSNSLTSMGVNAERGGGVMTRVMQDVYAAVQRGGDQLDRFASVAGMSSAEFARQFEADPIRAIAAFTDGLGAAKDSGDNVIALLDDLGYKGTQDTAVLLQLASAQGMVTENLDLGNTAWSENNALLLEAAQRYETTESKISIAKNSINDAAIDLGGVLLPVLAEGAEGAAVLAQEIADLPEPLQIAGVGLAGIAGTGALAGGAFLLLFPRVIDTYKAVQTLNTDLPGLSDGLGKAGRAAATMAAISVVAVTLDSVAAAVNDVNTSLPQLTQGLIDLSGDSAAFDEMFEDATRTAVGVNTLGEALDVLNPQGVKKINYEFNDILTKTPLLKDFGGNFVASFSGLPQAREQLEGIGNALGNMVSSGNVEAAAEGFDRLVDAENASAEASGRQARSRTELLELLPGYRDALTEVENAERLATEQGTALGGAVAAIGPNLDVAYGSLAGYAEALGYTEEQTEELTQQVQDWGAALAGFVDPLGTYTTLLGEKQAAEQATAQATADATASQTDSWSDYVADVDVALDQYLEQIEQQVRDQETWQVNMLALSGRVSQGTIDELARMGREGAPLVADLVDASDEELDRFDDVTARRSREATDAMAEQLRLAAPVLAEVAKIAGQGTVDALARELQAGTTTVAEIASEYGVELASGVNPLLEGLGKARINVARRAAGRGQQAYADGGIEDHTAQIAPAGAWRVWAEDETGGEAYIPLAPGKRTRSVDIWREVGSRLGVEFAEFAAGGFYSPDDVPRPRSTAPVTGPIGTGGSETMGTSYDQVLAWLEANPPEPEPSAGGGILAPTGAPAGGGIVALGRWLQSQGARVSEHSAFNGGRRVTGGHSRNSKHYQDRAIDVNTRPGTSALEQAELDKLAPLIRAQGFRVIWRAPGHFNHLHADYAQGGILNPHVRDNGGPLLPGYTLNATGGPEDVVPRYHDATRYHDVTTGGAGRAPQVDVYVQAIPDGEYVRHQAQVVVDGQLAAMANDVYYGS